MSIPEGIQPHHLKRLAVIYVRQSTQQQTKNNQESLQLQYNLADQARARGWDGERLRIIDTDLGRSASTTDGRPGFQELVTLVNREQVGILFAYDVTRIARNCTDWYQLLDLCGIRHCLVGDQDGIYDPSTPNGRLILGLKGMIAELELHTLRRRMLDGLLNKARRGELAQRLPAGLERDPLGTVVKTPDQEIQNRVDLVFDTFLRVGNLSQVVRFLNQRGLQVPRCTQFGDIVWRLATIGAIYSMLGNPAYAGAFVRGRRRSTYRDGKRVAIRVPMSEWTVCVQNKYPAYIAWETFVKIQAMLHDNYSEYMERQSRGVPRSGKGLLSGLMYCGECGHKMSVHYREGVYYACHSLRNKYGAGHRCQRVGAALLDRHVVRAFRKAVAPAELDAFVRAGQMLREEDAQVRQARQQQIERLRYQAHLAERQYHRSDPDNRLVTGELERRWERALRELRDAEDSLQRDLSDQSIAGVPDAESVRAFAAAEKRISHMWESDLLTAAQQKELLRCLVAKVVVRRQARDQVEVRIVWVGGETSTALIPVAVLSWEDLPCRAALEEAIEGLLREGKTDREIAEQLTREGFRSPRSEVISEHMVLRLRLRRRVLREKNPPRAVRGYLTVRQLAAKLKVAIGPIYDRIYSGKIVGARDSEAKQYMFPDEPRTIKLMQQLLAGKIQKVVLKGGHQDG